VAANRLVPMIQPFFDLGRHIYYVLAHSNFPGVAGPRAVDGDECRAEVDQELTAKALANCEADGEAGSQPWKEIAGLMEFRPPK
jgi:hypothetical protein